jgi:hypothetical protein
MELGQSCPLGGDREKKKSRKGPKFHKKYKKAALGINSYEERRDGTKQILFFFVTVPVCLQNIALHTV